MGSAFYGPVGIMRQAVIAANQRRPLAGPASIGIAHLDAGAPLALNLPTLQSQFASMRE
jgi:hypothetical protein